jgi:hypothetical protein
MMIAGKIYGRTYKNKRVEIEQPNGQRPMRKEEQEKEEDAFTVTRYRKKSHFKSRIR